MSLGLTDRLAEDLHCEYGDLRMTVEVVDGLQAAVDHINTFGRFLLSLSMINNLKFLALQRPHGMHSNRRQYLCGVVSTSSGQRLCVPQCFDAIRRWLSLRIGR